MPHMRWFASSMSQTRVRVEKPPVPSIAPQLPRPAEERQRLTPPRWYRQTDKDPTQGFRQSLAQGFTQRLHTKVLDTNCTCQANSSGSVTCTTHGARYSRIQSQIEQQKHRLHNVCHTVNETSQIPVKSSLMHPLWSKRLFRSIPCGHL